MISFSIDIRDNASPALAAQVAKLSPRRLNAAVGPRVSRLFQRNFRSLPANRMGGQSTHFWGRAAAATNWQVSPEGALIVVNQIGVRQRLLGGRIEAVNKENLTIPINPAAVGHVASDFPGLFCMVTKKGAYLVLGKANFGGLQFMFKLVKSVEQDPNPAVIPSKEAILAEAMQAINEATK